jgi:hypothetical protein
LWRRRKPCIDYRGLNDITVKNCYLLPLISSAFKTLQGANMFSKMDLHNAYHLSVDTGRGEVEDCLQHGK